MGRLRQAGADLWDRFIASDPGLIRLLSALNTVGAIIVTLGVLAALGTPVTLLVAGALAAMVSSFAISEPRLRDQAVTLALGLPTALASVSLATILTPYRITADLVFIALIFAAVYVRRFGERGTSLGVIAFQLFFVVQFLRAGTALLPKLCEVVVIAFCSSGFVRFGVLRATPDRVLGQLQRAFRVRLARVLDAYIDVLEAEPESVPTDRAAVELHRHLTRLHRCALMIQNRLESGAHDPKVADLVQRRVAEAEIAAERLGILLLRALRQDDADYTLTLHLPGHPPGTKPVPGPGEGRDAAALRKLAAELRALRLLISRTAQESAGTGNAFVRNRLLGYRDDERIPDASPAVQDAFRAVGEFARAMLGLRMVLEEDGVSADDSPETVRSREELEAEDALATAGEDREEPEHRTGLSRPSTRAAFQVATGSALAILGGELLSPQRWYWAVLTCWVVFINTSSTGEILVKGYRRLIGTVVGVVAGLGLASLVGGDTWLAFALVIICVFGMFFTAPLSYTLMSFFVTMMLGLLYTLLHTFSPAVLVLRIEETALGVTCGLIAAVLVLPVHTQDRTDAQLREVLQQLREVLAQAVAQLSGAPAGDLLDKARDLDIALDCLNRTLKPLTHPNSPLRARRRNARYMLGLLETCAYHARSLAATAEQIPDSLRIGADPRLAEAARRIDHNLQTLIRHLAGNGDKHARLESEPSIASLLKSADGADRESPDGDVRSTVTLRVLRHLQRLDELILGLARPLGLTTSDGEPQESGRRPKPPERISA
jgi:uncharacterized membrane protein YgaE (UPF0421/DUF939 family)